MPCYTPLSGQRDPGTGKVLGLKKTRLTWEEAESLATYDPVFIPCGRCIGCKVENGRQKAVRAMHELETSDDLGVFLTLTISDEHMRPRGHVYVRSLQKFFKRLRHYTGPFRYMACGEYGDETGRPHYHAILFGVDLHTDRTHFKTTREGHALWTHPHVEKAWRYGYHTIGEVTFESAAYVAQYVTKKVTGDMADWHYLRFDPSTPEQPFFQQNREFLLMSRGKGKRGLGYDWITKWLHEVYPADEIIVRGQPSKPPRYYDQVLKEQDPDLYDQVKASREQEATRLIDRHTAKKRTAAATINRSRMALYHREIE